MAYVVTGACKDCKYTDCVAVCPTDCFREDERMLYIDPDHCIDCDLCRPECPVDAIFIDHEVPEAERAWIAINAERSKVCPPITEKKEPLRSSG